MGRKNPRRRKQDHREKATAGPPDPSPPATSGGASFKFGPGLTYAIYLDAEGNTPVGIEGGGEPVNISGKFDHTPVPGGGSTYVRYMGTGKYAHPPADTAQETVHPAARFSSGYVPGVPGRRCACGFEAFTWQRTCPKCGGTLKGT